MNKPTNDTIAMGMRIQQSRKTANLTQIQFAEKIGVSTQYISDLERGVVGCSVPTLIKICDELDVSADFILRGRISNIHNTVGLLARFYDLPPQEQKLMVEGFNLLHKAFSMK